MKLVICIFTLFFAQTLTKKTSNKLLKGTTSKLKKTAHKSKLTPSKAKDEKKSKGDNADAGDKKSKSNISPDKDAVKKDDGDKAKPDEEKKEETKKDDPKENSAKEDEAKSDDDETSKSKDDTDKTTAATSKIADNILAKENSGCKEKGSKLAATETKDGEDSDSASSAKPKKMNVTQTDSEKTEEAPENPLISGKSKAKSMLFSSADITEPHGKVNLIADAWYANRN